MFPDNYKLKKTFMTISDIFNQIKEKSSFLCVGLDSDIEKIPTHLLNMKDPVFEFNKQIVDTTSKYAVSYKLNTAFYESRGVAGWESMQRTAEYINRTFPEIFLIADAKRGDIGNTSQMYAKAFFDNMPFDAVTVAPYMGEDSITPFLSYPDKFVIILALTSNQGAYDFQYLKDEKSGNKLFESVLHKSKLWGSPENTMYVAGATKPEELKEVRKLIPDHFLLVPGIGAQGGSLKDVLNNAGNNKCGLLVNSSRGIIFANNTKEFAKVAGEKAKELRDEMDIYIQEFF